MLLGCLTVATIVETDHTWVVLPLFQSLTKAVADDKEGKVEYLLKNVALKIVKGARWQLDALAVPTKSRRLLWVGKNLTRLTCHLSKTDPEFNGSCGNYTRFLHFYKELDKPGISRILSVLRYRPMCNVDCYWPCFSNRVAATCIRVDEGKNLKSLRLKVITVVY